jgi:hypothetical protein
MMKSINTVLVGVLSLQGVLAGSAEQDQNGAIKPTTISAQNAVGGLKKLVDRGFLAVSKSFTDGIPNRDLLKRSQGRARGQRTAGLGKTRGKKMPKGGTKGGTKGTKTTKQSGSGARNGGQQQSRGSRGGYVYEHPQMMDDPYMDDHYYPTEQYMDDPYVI